jgi:uncharacterized delta-60 repeat protein
MDIRRAVWGLCLSGLVAAAPAVRADETTLDPSFGTNGVVLTPFDLSGITRIASQADGKILVPGFTFGGSGIEAVIARYKPEGTLDASFGTGGSSTTDFGGSSGSNWATSAVEQSDGKIVIAGLASGSEIGVARFNADGTPDPSFGTGGVVSTSVGGAFLVANTLDVLVAPDGKILALATASTTGPAYVTVVARYLANGTLDGTFGSGGLAFLVLDTNTFADQMALQSDGKIVVVGSKSASLSFLSAAFVARLDDGGLPDGTFGSAGAAFLGGGVWQFEDVVQQPDGKLAIVGSATTGVLVARYDGNGDLDPSFGTGGVTVSDFVPEFEAGNGLVLQPDGKVVITGTSSNTGTGAFRVARYTAAGVLDPTFGVGGTTTVDVTSGNDFGYQILRQADGKLVIGGAANSTNDIALARLGTGCLSSPALGCKQATRPRASAFKVKGGPRPNVKFKWAKGEATTLGELGDPTTTTTYQLCAWDLSPTGSRTLALDAPAGGTCGNRPCWSATPSGFRYRAPAGAPDGMTGLKLKSGAADAARLVAKAKGENLDAPALPMAVPLRVQVVGSNGTCFEADFSTVGVKRNDTGGFSAKSD